MKKLYSLDYEKNSVVLHDPKGMPNAGGFLWNKQMMLQMNCRGFAVSQFMQPEPRKYAQGPALEANTFMQPEHHYYQHHPGRFFYLKNRATKRVFSVPFEPMRVEPKTFKFEVLNDRFEWVIEYDQVEIHLRVMLTPDDSVELWSVEVKNGSESQQELSLYPYFPFGYQSWMNQSANYCSASNGIIASKVTPYQVLEDYWKNQKLKELSFLIAEQTPNAWCANANQFEGWGGLSNPDGIAAENLNNAGAHYDVPVATLQYDFTLLAGQTYSQRFVFGAAKDNTEIQQLKRKYLSELGFKQAQEKNQGYLNQVTPACQIETEDPAFDQFINLWLPRQVFYHGDVDRLTTDPQTRNYLQDAMGMLYLDSASTRQKIIKTLEQQHSDGSLPDGVLLHKDAELKYINKIPHSDHCIWLPICLHSYICETGDIAILDTLLPFSNDTEYASVFEHVERAMLWLFYNLDERGLSLIQQGDWCDPMNMVGYQGKGVSAWLSMATSYAWQLWAELCAAVMQQCHSKRWRCYADILNKNTHHHFWRDDWYARGITDEGRLFGTSDDAEGSMYLNPQSWAMMAELVPEDKVDALVNEVETRLGTPFGICMLGPAYTGMVEDIGRLTQKFPGTAENGSIYNHAVVFYAFALYQKGKSEQAYSVLKRMLVSPSDSVQREQLPVFIPNYYRGAADQFPTHLGRSSQLFNTGTVAWYYRCIVEGLFGVKATLQGLKFEPQLPKDWGSARIVRRFRGATFHIEYKRGKGKAKENDSKTMISLNGEPLHHNVIDDVIAGREYHVEINLLREN